MSRAPRASRRLAEIVAIVLLVELGVWCLVPPLAAQLETEQHLALHAALFALLAGPLVVWRLRRHPAQPQPEAPRAAGRPSTRRHILAVSLATFAVGCSLTALIVASVHKRACDEARAQFDRLADRVAAETERRVNQPVTGLSGARGVYAASKSVERLEFRAYVQSRDLPGEFPGALGLGFIERVPRAELEDFQRRERADEAPDFTVRSSGELPDMYVIKFIEPLEMNGPAWGYDLGSEEACRASLDLAVRSGKPTITPKIELVQGDRERPGFLFLVPIYLKGPEPTTTEEREKKLVGIVFAPLVLDEVFSGATSSADGLVDLDVFDGALPDPGRLLYDWDGKPDDFGPGSDAGSGRPMFRDMRKIPVGGRIWTLAVSSTPTFETQVQTDAPRLIGMAGVLLSALLSYLIWSLGSGRARAIGLAELMTADLATAKRAAESALRDFEAMRGTLDEHSIVSVTDARGRIIDVNKAFCRISSFSREELIGQDHRLMNSGHHPKSFWMEAWRTIIAGRPWRAEICNRARNGSLYWVDTVIAPFVSENGLIERFFSISTDITARKQAEAEQMAALALATALARAGDAREAARAVNDALGETTNLSRSAVLLYEYDGVCRFVGWRGLSMEFRRAIEGHCPWKQGQPDAVPMIVEDALCEPSLSNFRDLFRREGIATLAFVPIMTEKGVIGKLMLYASKPGTMTPARIQAARSAAAALGSAVARLRMAEALSTNERRFRSLVEGSEVIVWEFDPLRDVFTYISPQASRLGYPLERWSTPGFWAEHMHHGDREPAVAYRMGETRAGRNHRFQYRMLAADGHPVWMDDFASVERLPSGHVLLRGVLVDISESKQVAQELREARARAEAATQAKSEFLANMSHEIRTPLTAILGYSELLREDGDTLRAPERRAQALDTICGAGQYLLTVINDVLDLSKIEAGKMTVERVETSPAKILLEVADLVRPRAAAKNVELRARLDTPLPERVFSDPTRMRQILMNLAGNAAKFTESGSVTLAAREEPREGGARLVIDVDDTGPGLEPDVATRLFVAFSQADASVTRKHGGTGLGLTICRRLAELMGGTVTLVRTAPGRGSCFRVELPCEPVPGAGRVASLDALPQPVQPLSALPTALLSGRILLAEDGRDNQRLIELLLKRAGAELEIADNGLIALEKLAKAAAAGRPFDLLLSDMQMPEMDGYTLARTLRAQGSTIAIVALTAHAMAEDRQRCIEAGCDDYATKPIDRKTLLEACTRWIGKPSAAKSVRGPA